MRSAQACLAANFRNPCGIDVGTTMLFGDDKDNDPEDMFKDTRMSFGDHIEDLRIHLLRGILGFLAALIASFAVGKYLVEFIGRPVREQLLAYQEEKIKNLRKEMETDETLKKLNKPRKRKIQLRKVEPGEADDQGDENTDDSTPFETYEMKERPLEVALDNYEKQMLAITRPTLTTLSVQEGFVVFFKVCIVAAIVMASPWLFYQIWSFVAAGLYPHEKRYVNRYLPISLGLFLAGVALCEFVVLPLAIKYLLSFNEWLGLEPELRLSEWLSFAIMVPLIFGVAFQMPLVMLFLNRMGIMTVEQYLKRWRISLFVLMLLAALIIPSPDPLSFLSLAIPLWGLYWLGIFMCWMAGEQKPFDIEVPEPEEMVEV
jgi:sec-independent protein translocase protein TatC